MIRPHRLHTALMLFLCFCSHADPLPAWTEGPGYRTRELRLAGFGKPGFSLRDPKGTGVLFTNVLHGDAYLTNAVAHNGSGVAIGDVDNDGWVDLYFCNLQGPNRLYRNLGNWHFEEVALGEAACAGQMSTGATFADVDGDGNLDLLVNGIATGTRLFLNDGKGRFTEVKNSGLSHTASATSLALADMDGDGDLDLYCAHYIDVMHMADPTMRFGIMMRNGRWLVTKVNGELATLPQWKDRFEALPGGKVRELPEVHGLYRNDGHGHFTAIQFEPGVFSNAEGKPIPPYRDWGLSVMFRDLNGDGIPDLYVCNDNASPDRVWINSGHGTFRALSTLALRHTSRSSMGIDVADVNRDGRDDIFTLDMLARGHTKRMTQLVRDHSDAREFEQIDAQPRYNRNMLLLSRPDGSYAEVALMAGVAASDWSWCPIFLDVDLDGYEDLLISNGFSFDVMDQDVTDQIRQDRNMTREQLQRSRRLYASWPTRNAAFRNRHDGTFEPANLEWGFDQPGVSNGMALGDLDNDGDLDVVINNLNGAATLLRNDTTAPRVAVRLKGKPPNTQGIGARLQLVSGVLTQSQEMICGGRYLSGDQSMRVFATPAGWSGPIRLEVRWRNGEQTVISNVLRNHLYEVDQLGATLPPPRPALPDPAPLFTDASALLGYLHEDEAFDDYARQPLLPHRLSRLGPGVAWSDLNGDGWEDLIVAGGRGGRLAVFTNDHGTGFRAVAGTPLASPAQGAVLTWPDGQGRQTVLAAISNYELGPEQPAEIVACQLPNLATSQKWPAGTASLGPMALADIDGEDDLDLFVGGRFRPGHYPEAVSSAIWRNENGRLQPDAAASEPFKSIGLVSGATFADLDGDGWPDLALAMDWGPVRIFHNDRGRFREITGSLGLLETTGCWTSIVAGDFDGDGRLDLAVGNWGRNTSFELSRPGPWRLFYGEWSGRGVTDIIEAWRRGEDWLPVRDRRALTSGLPDLPNRFPTHQAFAGATLREILGEHYSKAAFVEATTLESVILLNRGTSFHTVPLPAEAQWTPVFSLNVGDFDGDGIEDLFVAQNFFGTASEHTREDAGYGLR
jgi:hypothetical protein